MTQSQQTVSDGMSKLTSVSGHVGTLSRYMTFLSAFEAASCQHQVNKCKLTCHHIHIMLARVGQFVVNGTFRTTRLYPRIPRHVTSF